MKSQLLLATALAIPLIATAETPRVHERNLDNGLKVLVKYHLMDEQQQAWPDFLSWFSATPLCQAVWLQLGSPDGTPAAFAEHIVHELVRGGALHWREGWMFDA